MNLESVGFEVDEVFPCEIQDRRIIVPALVAGQASKLLLDTGAADEIILDLSYVREQQFPFNHHGLFSASLADDVPREGGYATVPEIATLGRTLRREDIAVKDVIQPDIIPHPVAGLLGAEFFRNGILGIDPKRCRVGFSTRRTLSNHRHVAALQLRTLPLACGCVPITHDLNDGFSRRNTGPVLVLDTGSKSSYLMLDYIQREHRLVVRWLSKWVHRLRRPIRWSFGLPDGTLVRPLTWLRTSLSPYAERRGLPQIDGILGMNFLDQWITVFDFVTGQVDLVEY